MKSGLIFLTLFFISCAGIGKTEYPLQEFQKACKASVKAQWTAERTNKVCACMGRNLASRLDHKEFAFMLAYYKSEPKSEDFFKARKDLADLEFQIAEACVKDSDFNFEVREDQKAVDAE